MQPDLKSKAAAENFVKDQDKGQNIYYIDIPPAMRDKVLAEGFPLFSANVPVIDNDQTR